MPAHFWVVLEGLLHLNHDVDVWVFFLSIFYGFC
jgi:hypothetical protein